MRQLSTPDKNRMRWSSDIYTTLRAQFRDKQFYDAWNTVMELLVRARGAQRKMQK
jgi:hypothetical protein